MLSERLGISYDKYQLITDINERNLFLSQINIYIQPFLSSIWDNPKSLATILSVADKNDIKNNLAHFVTHNLYENIISSNGKDEQLMYIITLLLKEEINNLNNNESNSSNFLKDSTCGYILSELIQKKDIQIFFKGIIYEIIKK